MKATHNTHPPLKPEHGRLTSYLIGFVLSLVFTLIPYYLVVYRSFTGNKLIAIIIGFAIVQLVIQVLFFLHLGRERKPRWNLFFFGSTISIILVVVGGSIWIINHLHYNMSALDVTNKITVDEAVYKINGVQAGTCPGGTGKTYKIELQNNTLSSRHVNAHLCDTLMILNLDDTAHQIDFGVYGTQETYAGQTGESIRPGRSMAITLTQLGTHQLHDNALDKVSADFTVAP